MPLLRQNILATLAYYDVFDFPLKTDEISGFLVNFKHLGLVPELEIASKALPEQVRKELDALVEEKTVNFADDFYFLSGKEYLIPLRLKREKLAETKFKKVLHAAKWLRFLPYLEAVFASGSLAMRNTDELSDLDVLVVVRAGRIWLARLLITGLLSLLGVRRKGSEKISPDKICLNHYITDESLSIPFRSIYNAETYGNLAPIYVKDEKLLGRFKKENDWVLDYVCGWGRIDEKDRNRLSPGSARPVAKLGEIILNTKLGDALEKLAKKYQSKRIAANPLTKKSGGRVIFNDEHLEFHPDSMEKEIIKKYNNRLTELGLGEFAREKNSGLLNCGT